MADVSPLYAATRRALLDALDALASQQDGLVLVGAQAIFLHTGDVDEAIATETKDADLALDPAALHANPLLETAMTSAGFHLDITNPQPGSWISRAGYPVDLLLPEAVSGRSGKGRAGRIPPHDNMSARRVLGIEGALVDHSEMRVAALTSDDVRAHTLKVAGPAALLVAKQYKIFERLAQPARQRPRDSHDVYRLLREIEPEVFVAGFELMLGNEISAAVARDAIGHLETLFGEPGGSGAQQAAQAVAPLVEEPEIVAIRCAALRSLARCFPRSPKRGRPLACALAWFVIRWRRSPETRQHFRQHLVGERRQPVSRVPPAESSETGLEQRDVVGRATGCGPDTAPSHGARPGRTSYGDRSVLRDVGSRGRPGGLKEKRRDQR